MLACLPCLKRLLVHLQGVAMALVAPEMLREGHGKPAASMVPSPSWVSPLNNMYKRTVYFLILSVLKTKDFLIYKMISLDLSEFTSHIEQDLVRI